MIGTTYERNRNHKHCDTREDRRPEHLRRSRRPGAQDRVQGFDRARVPY